MRSGRGRFHSGSLLVIILLLTIAHVSPCQTFSIIELQGPPGSTGTYGMKINNHGVAVGGAEYANTGTHAVIWQAETPVDLNLSSGGWSSGQANGINDAGEVVGSLAKQGAGGGFTYSGGTLSLIPAPARPLPGSSFSEPYSVNSEGNIVGMANFTINEPGAGGQTSYSYYLPFLYSNGAITTLPLLPGDTHGYAVAINDAGQIAGYSYGATGTMNSVIYSSNGSMSVISPLPSGGMVGVLGLNNAGQAVGSASVQGGARHAFLYSAGNTTDLGVPNGFNSSQAEAINDSGDIVGEAYYQNYGGASHAFLYSNGSWKDLNLTIPPDSGLVLKWASGINNQGQIVGTATLSGQDAAYVLTPTTPNSSLSAIANAASGLGGAISPGEFVTLYGSGLGPSAPVQSNSLARGLGGTRVFFNGVEAFLAYTSAGQINALVPYGITGASQVEVCVTTAGPECSANPLGASMSVQLVPATPGIFTVNATGSGQAVVVNQDGTLNSTSNPAARGTIIALWATGQGQTNPPSYDGVQPGGPLYPVPSLPVTVTIGGVPAAPSDVVFCGLVYSGVMQVNVRIPQAVAPGPSVGIVLNVGGAGSAPSVALAVR